MSDLFDDEFEQCNDCGQYFEPDESFDEDSALLCPDCAD